MIKRRQCFLRDSNQPLLMLKFFGILLLCLVVSGVLFYVVARHDLSESYFKAHITIKNTMEILLPLLLIANVIGLFSVVFFAIHFTHKIAGPIYRLRADSKEIAAGDLTKKIRFRRGDYVHDVAACVNEIVESFRSRISNIKAEIDKLEKQAYKSPDRDEIEKNIAKISEYLSEIKL